MSVRELVVLGTASQVPTRYRNHNGYLLRWDGAGLLFDPGEGTQRQTLLAGVSAKDVTRIFDGELIVAADLDRVPVPPRRSARSPVHKPA